MVKKQPKNSFYFFMVDYKKREEEKGRRFYNGMAQVAEECGPEWKLVSPEDKAKYEIMAKQAKQQRKMDPRQKYTSYGETFSEVERKKEEEERKKLEKKQKVEQIVQYLKPESTLKTKSFFVAHVNFYFVDQKNGFHLPAELAICEFSLERGIIHSFHALFRPDSTSFPLGYAGVAKVHGDKTHKIPHDGNLGSKDLSRTYNMICEFMQGSGKGAQGGELPPVYTMGHDEGQNTSEKAVCDCFKHIYDKTHTTYDDEDAWMDQFKVYELSKLFYELKSKTDAYARSCGYNDGLKGKFPQQSLAEDELRKDVFNYTPKIACNFHEVEDNVAHCSLSFVRRWVYLICDYCCQDLQIELIPGKHVPAKADVLRPSRAPSAASSRMPSRAPSRNAFSEVNYADDDDRESLISGKSAYSLDYNAVKSLNTEKSQMGRPSTKVTAESLRLPKTATAGRGAQLLGASRSSIIDEKPGRTRTHSETSNKSFTSVKSENTIKALRVDEREVTSVGKSLASVGIKPIDPSVYGIEILQGADEIAAAEAARKAALETQPPKPLFAPDSFPSLRGFGRGRKVSGRGK